MTSLLSQSPICRVMGLMRLTDDSVESALDATNVSGGASPFTVAGGCRRVVIVVRCLAGTAVELRIPNLS